MVRPNNTAFQLVPSDEFTLAAELVFRVEFKIDTQAIFEQVRTENDAINAALYDTDVSASSARSSMQLRKNRIDAPLLRK